MLLVRTSIIRDVKNAVAQLRDVELFHDEKSPYAPQTARLAIPKHPLKEDAPHMLMEGLTGHPNDANTCIISKTKLTSFVQWCVCHPGVVVGGNGCGKTRTIFETLSADYGLYFVVDPSKHGGWQVRSCPLLY